MQIRARGIHTFGYHGPNPLVFTPRRGINMEYWKGNYCICNKKNNWGNNEIEEMYLVTSSQILGLLMDSLNLDWIMHPNITAQQ